MAKPWHQFYPEGIPFEVKKTSITSIFEILENAVAQHSSKIAVIDGERELTFFELKNAAEQLAAALFKRGFKKGDCLALMLPNCIEYIITFFAVQRLGGKIVQVNPMYQPFELDHILKDSEASWFVGRQEEKGKLNSIGLTNNIKPFFVDGEKEEALYSLIDKQENNLPNVQINIDEDIAVLQYTGGTTGRPKGVMLTHFNIIMNIEQAYVYGENIYKNGPHRFLGLAPMFHGMGMSSMILCLFYGGTYIALEKFKVEPVIELIRKHRPTLFTGSPTVYIALLNYPGLREDDFSSFKLLVAGSSPVSIEVINQFKKITNALLIEGFGQSEATTSTHRSPIPGKMKIGSIGIPIPSTDAKIVDTNSGETEMPIGETGELIIKGPQVMKGYWKNEEETNKTIRNGWLYTGDLATQDEDGYFYIVGRKKEMIIAGGYNIYPIEVENVLYEHPLVQEVCVFGVPDPYRIETVKAVIVTNGPVNEAEIIDWCIERLAKYKVPRIVEFRDELPKSVVGKILKYKLMEENQENDTVKAE